jgi:excisionase family DNA binding protein
MPQPGAAPKLMTVAQAASLLAVSDKTIRRWIDAERIPYLRLPGGGYRIPVGALLASLGGNYALDEELVQIDQHTADVSEEELSEALESPGRAPWFRPG